MGSTPKHSLAPLIEHRPALLLAEIAAWLHMFGKLHECFLKGNHNLDIQIPNDAPKELKNLLNKEKNDNWAGKIWGPLHNTARDISISTFIRKHREQVKNSITGLLQDAHGRGSGIEKGVLNRFTSGQKGDVYLSSAMGAEVGPIPHGRIKAEREKFYAYLIALLRNARNGQVALTRQDTKAFRRFFEITVAETRRPLNDVTLFDQTVASVAFFKAALAQVLLTEWKDPSAEKVEDKYRWRVLRVGFNGPAFWGQANGISDLLARKDLMTEVLNKVNDLLEREYPLGSEIYRDENGSLFLVPGIKDLLTYKIGGKNLKDVLQETAADVLAGEARLELTLSDPSRSIREFGEIVAKELHPPSPTLEQVQKAWNKPNATPNREICSVCGLRPQGSKEKSLERKVCDICEERRQDRSQEWAKNLGCYSSIWMNEIADQHGRLALLVGQFGLEPWLSGKALNSVMKFDPKQRTLVDEKRNSKKYEFQYAELIEECDKAVRYPRRPLGKQQAKLLDNLLLKDRRGGHTNLGGIYDLYVNDTDLRSDKREAWRFALVLMRQQPSFARIRRVWETTQEFWRSVESDLPITIKKAGPRLAITGRFASLAPSDLGKFHAYELALPGGTRLNVVWDAPKSRFITADNLERIANLLGREPGGDAPTATAYLIENLRGKTLKIQEPGGYGSTDKFLGKLENTSLKVIPNSEYTPSIVILAEPRTFMAIVPAGSAWNVIEHIRAKYEQEMGKVRNRLPVRLGVVYAPQHTPVRALIDAGRRMLRGKSLPVEGWRVTACREDTNAASFPEVQEVTLEREQRQVVWQIPLKMGDSKTDDVWYPYLYVQQANPKHPIEERKRHVLAANPWGAETSPFHLVHATDLHPDDIVHFVPSTLDFIWLGSAAQRFEVAYDASGQRRGLPRRPYLLDELTHLKNIRQTLENHLTVNQRYILRDIIESRRESWLPSPEDCQPNGVFWQFCRDAVANADWRGKKPWTSEELDLWADYAVRGWLADVVELHLHILKGEHQPAQEEATHEQ